MGFTLLENNLLRLKQHTLKSNAYRRIYHRKYKFTQIQALENRVHQSIPQPATAKRTAGWVVYAQTPQFNSGVGTVAGLN